MRRRPSHRDVDGRSCRFCRRPLQPRAKNRAVAARIAAVFRPGGERVAEERGDVVGRDAEAAFVEFCRNRPKSAKSQAASPLRGTSFAAEIEPHRRDKPKVLGRDDFFDDPIPF